MWTEIAIAGGFVGTQGIILGWINAKINKMESDRKKELYGQNGQTNFILRKECLPVQQAFLSEVKEIKHILDDMNNKRENDKDQYHNGQLLLAERLTRIEGKLP